MIEPIFGLIVAVGLGLYLLYTLLRPEKFWFRGFSNDPCRLAADRVDACARGRLRHSLEQNHRGRLRRRKKLSDAGARAGRARLLPAGGRRPGAGAGLVRLYGGDGRLFRRRIPVALRLAALAELSAAEPARLRRRR